MTIRKNWMKTKRNPTLKSTFLRILGSIQSLKWALLGIILSLVLFGHCFGYDKWQAPANQPDQMRSPVLYDPKLMDTFFESDADGYEAGSRITQSGTKRNRYNRPETARCFSNSLGVKHLVNFCDAKLVDENSIDFLIHYTGPAYHDMFRVQVRTEMFMSQYWTFYQQPHLPADFIWTTKRQELTLDKQAYQKGELIKGRVDFECLQEATNPLFVEKHGKWPTTIKVYGVFYTIVK